VAKTDLETAAADAPYIFVGTVEHAGASSVAGAPADEHTGIVRVEEVVRAPAAVGLVAGATVTVRSEASPPEAGERALYVADSWVYGDGIAVNERAKQAMGAPTAGAEPGASAEAAQPSGEHLQALEQAPLRARARNADVIVSGRVVSLEPTEGAGPGAEVTSEHDPQWWHAEIAVDDVLKGKHSGKTVRVAFPSSTDVAWYRWPRPTAGQTGVFLLHQPEAAEVKNAYVMPSELDMQPHGTAEHVQALARRTRTGG
jgi:hypothetical protein